MIKDLLKDEEVRMKKALEALKHDLTAIRTGRASPALVEQLQVEAYGAVSPLIQLATISAPEARLITIRPFDASTMQGIEKAILRSDLGLTPSNDGKVIRLPIPALTAERRKELVKTAKNMLEECRVGIRNHRHKANEKITKAQKDKTISEDESRRAQDEVQKIHDQFIKAAEGVFHQKEKELQDI